MIGQRIYAHFRSGTIRDWTHLGEEDAREYAEQLEHVVVFAGNL